VLAIAPLFRLARLFAGSPSKDSLSLVLSSPGSLHRLRLAAGSARVRPLHVRSSWLTAQSRSGRARVVKSKSKGKINAGLAAYMAKKKAEKAKSNSPKSALSKKPAAKKKSTKTKVATKKVTTQPKDAAKKKSTKKKTVNQSTSTQATHVQHSSHGRSHLFI